MFGAMSIQRKEQACLSRSLKPSDLKHVVIQETFSRGFPDAPPLQENPGKSHSMLKCCDIQTCLFLCWEYPQGNLRA